MSINKIQLTYNFSSTNTLGYKASQDYGQYFEANYWHQYIMWNQSHNQQKCMLKQEAIAETPVSKTNNNLSLVGK